MRRRDDDDDEDDDRDHALSARANMKTCPDCGKRVSKSATTCPRCGCYMPRFNILRVLLLLLIVLVLWGIFCVRR